MLILQREIELAHKLCNPTDAIKKAEGTAHSHNKENPREKKYTINTEEISGEYTAEQLTALAPFNISISGIKRRLTRTGMSPDDAIKWQSVSDWKKASKQESAL